MSHGKTLPIACLLALTLGTSLSVHASENSFAKAYSDYQAAVEKGDTANIEASAKAAYQLGEAQYAKDSIDLANLAINWAAAIEKQVAPYPFREKNLAQTAKANELYQLALANYNVHYGKEALELIDPLLGSAITESKAKVAKDYLQAAIDIAEKSDNKKLIADVKMAAFNRLSNTELYTKSIRNYAFDAYDIYKEILPENALDRVKATYVVGAVEYAEKHDDKAIPLLLEVVKQFDVLNYSHPYALSAHAYLVELYERQGKRDESTAHCIAIGKMRPWTDEQEQQPIFRINPKYPLPYAQQRKSGWVQLKFTVDEHGFVKNPEIIASKGGALFEKESIKTLDKWRYAPKFENGKAVEAQTSVQLDYTINR
ncbi:energy transducer TonB [Shewanella baltica]|uniref:energy transducer TonB n=1 Tax=Shewanella baltica TaxID=62322 RepID=UPI00217E79E8|nr:energy transducer TonB [Shewanella baltica]MCS6192470.1 energy transducer TonB [Shewanella baltica]